ncbi:MAG: sodium-dependent transporter [Nevskiales bacterium]
MTREHWGSRLGFIMAAAGSAIGLGNIWRFPYMTGSNGGGAFLLIYLGIVIGFGLSLMLAEMVLGRTAQRNPVGAFRQLGGGAWAIVGVLGILTGFIILSFYIVVAGWTLAYIVFMARGVLTQTDTQGFAEIFNGFVSSPLEPIAYAGIFMLLTALIVSGGITSGIERWNKILMPALFVLLLILVARAVTLPGAAKGLAFYLVPDFSKVTAATFRDAISQAFFSLSIGMGAMLTYGSYLKKDENLPSAALTVVLLDAAAAVLAGLMIIPAVFAAGLSPSAGPGLTFITLPAVFQAMPFGAFFGVLFFALLAIAALTSAVSILEPLVAWGVDEKKMSRSTLVWSASAVCFLISIPASLSFGVGSGYTIAGKSFFDLLDFLSNSVLLQVGGILTAFFVGWRWAKPALQALSNDGALHQPWAPLWLFVLRFLAPPGIAWIMISAFIG